MAAAALAMIRGLLVADASTAEEFIQYAVTLSSGYFLGYLLSFGSVEQSYKQFPRLVAQHGFSALLGPVGNVLGQLGSRAAGLVVICSLFWSATGISWFADFILAIMFGLVASFTSVIASVQRALSSHRRLSASNLIRSILAFVVVVPLAYLTDIRWVIAGELIAAFLGFFASCKLSELTLQNLKFVRPSLHSTMDGIIRGFFTNKGLMVSGCTLIMSIPYYLDRAFVAKIFTADVAATYALLAIFLSAATVLMGAIVQRTGAEIVKMVLEVNSLAHAITYVFRWSFVGVCVWSAFIFTVGAAFNLELLPDGLLKYEISLTHIYPVAVLGGLGVSGLVEFLFIALDEEWKLFRTALFYLAIILLFSLLPMLYDISIINFLWLLVAGRAFYLSLLCIILASRLNQQRRVK